MAAVNLNALNGLFLWGILSPTQLSQLTGVSLSLCSRQLRFLAENKLAFDHGRSRLSPSDNLYGRYFSIRKCARVKSLCGGTPYSFGRVRKGVGRDKIVSFSNGGEVSRHYLFSVQSAAWTIDFLARNFPSKTAVGFPETYLRRKLGWHHYMGPARSVANPKFTMVPDSLIIFGDQEIRIEAEITPKTAKAYRDLFFAARPADDTILYVFPDQKTMDLVMPVIPSGYRVFGCILGDTAALRAAVFRMFPSLSGR